MSDAIEGLIGEVSVGGTLVGYLRGVTLSASREAERARHIGSVRSDLVLPGQVNFRGGIRRAYVCDNFFELFESDAEFQGTFYPRGSAECGRITGVVLFTGWGLENWRAESEAAKIENVEFVLYDVSTVVDEEMQVDVWFPVVAPDGYIGTHPAIILTDGLDVPVYGQIYAPADMLTLDDAYVIVVAAATGNMRRSVSTNWGKLDGSENYNTGSDSIAAGQVAVTLNRLSVIDIEAALTGVAAGDLIGITFTREASNVNDTVNANCYYLGVLLRYTR